MLKPLSPAINKLTMNGLVNKVLKIFITFPGGQCGKCYFRSAK